VGRGPRRIRRASLGFARPSARRGRSRRIAPLARDRTRTSSRARSGQAAALNESRTAEKRDELAALHSITSSARASTGAGRSSPNAFAVLSLRYFDPEYRINRTPLQGAWLLRGWLVSGATKSPATSIIPRLLTIATYIGRAPMPIGRLRAIEENPMTLF